MVVVLRFFLCSFFLTVIYMQLACVLHPLVCVFPLQVDSLLHCTIVLLLYAGVLLLCVGVLLLCVGVLLLCVGVLLLYAGVPLLCADVPLLCAPVLLPLIFDLLLLIDAYLLRSSLLAQDKAVYCSQSLNDSLAFEHRIHRPYHRPLIYLVKHHGRILPRRIDGLFLEKPYQDVILKTIFWLDGKWLHHEYNLKQNLIHATFPRLHMLHFSLNKLTCHGSF